MAEEDRTFSPSTVQANRARTQGLGVGQEEIDRQLDPDRDTYATDPQRTEPFDQSLDPTTNSDRPSQADFSGQEPGDVRDSKTATRSGPESSPLDDRNAAGLHDAGDLGAGTPANVDIHDLGQDDNPEQEWGDEVEEGAVFSANHTRRPIRTEAERGQGAKTRAHTKDIISRRT